MPWQTAPTGAGGMVDHAATMVRCNQLFDNRDFSVVIELMYSWLNNNQSGTHGLWGKLEAQGHSGLVLCAYHAMRCLYFHDNIRPKYLEKMIDTVLYSISSNVLFSEGLGEGCHDLDHFVVLERLFHFTEGSYKPDTIQLVAEKRLSQIIKSVQSDGAFSFTPTGTIQNHYGYILSPGTAGSDIIGSLFYLETVQRLSQILGYHVNLNRSVTHG